MDVEALGERKSDGRLGRKRRFCVEPGATPMLDQIDDG